MKLKRVISGGQTGADRTGLECARELGLETGGTVPKHCRTESGIDLSLKDFGVVESDSVSYAPRTKKNVKDAEVTLWFGNLNSSGYWCTRNAADNIHHKPFIENPDAAKILELADQYAVWNVAGNRASTNPNVEQQVRDAFEVLRQWITKKPSNE